MTAQIFFHDKYQPKNLDEISHNSKTVELLKSLTKEKRCKTLPHLYICGLSTNNTTPIMKLFIKELFYDKGDLEIKTIRLELTSTLIINIKRFDS